MDKDQATALTALVGEANAQLLIGMTLLVHAIRKQPGIDKAKLKSDLIAMLPDKAQEPQGLLGMWREVLETNLP